MLPLSCSPLAPPVSRQSQKQQSKSHTEKKLTSREWNRNRNRKLLISRAPTKAKSQEPAYSQALNQNKIDRQRSRSRESGRQTVRRLWWMVLGVKTRREVHVWGRRCIGTGFAKEQCFQFGVKELWRDGKGRGLSELIGWVRYICNCRNADRSLFQRGGTATAMERLESLSDAVTEGRSTSSVRVDGDRVERGGWMADN